MTARIALALAVTLLFVGAVAATYGVAFATDAGRRADARIFNRIGRGDQSQLRTDLRKLAQRIGGRKLNVVAAIGVAVAGALLALLATLRKTRVKAMVVVGLVAGAFGTTELIKPPLGRWGEELAPDRVATNAFPSGHATLAMAIVLAYVLATPIGGRIAVTFAGAALATVLGLLIVVGGLHPPSDVVGGYFVSGAWAALLTFFVRRRPDRDDRIDYRHPVLRRFAIVVVVLASIAFASAVAIYVEDIFGVHRTLVFLVGGLVAVSTLVVGVIATLAELEALDETSALR